MAGGHAAAVRRTDEAKIIQTDARPSGIIATTTTSQPAATTGEAQTIQTVWTVQPILNTSKRRRKQRTLTLCLK